MKTISATPLAIGKPHALTGDDVWRELDSSTADLSAVGAGYLVSGAIVCLRLTKIADPRCKAIVV